MKSLTEQQLEDLLEKAYQRGLDDVNKVSELITLNTSLIERLEIAARHRLDWQAERKRLIDSV